MKNLQAICSLVLLLLILAFPAQCLAKNSPLWPETIELEGAKLALNGTGLRTATIFKVKVYEAGLYLEEKSSSSADILNSIGKKQLTMWFVRSVDAEKLIDGWNTGFKNNNSNTKALQSRISTFNSFMENVDKGHKIVLTFNAKSVAVELKGKMKGSINGMDFSKALLAIWLGPNPPNDALKAGLLGK